MTPTGFAECHIEEAALGLFGELGWHTVKAQNETFGAAGTLGRENSGEVVLLSRLRPALRKLNPQLPEEAFDLAVEELLRDRSRMSRAAANRDVYQLLKQGVPVRIPDPEGDGDQAETVRLIDWSAVGENDFLVVSQFWVAGEMYTRRADLVGFVNGIPLLFIELKASHTQLQAAYTGNLTDYKDTVPHLFWYNTLIVLSNGSETKVGTVTSAWEHFNEWKKVGSEEEQGVISLETVIRGTCQPARLLDLAENFVLFMEIPGGLIKLGAKNHQFLGVTNAIAALQEIQARGGKLGVFWHTQGSGKSVSMIFFSQKVLRKMPGNWTFVVVTDRRELDDQIYKNFADCGAITEGHCQAESAKDLRRLLKEDHRFVFTLIHKFRTDDGSPHPVLSDRDDIIVITDEAHRSQYDTLALNMRNALPRAAFLAFTGTPLIIGEEKTREVFGDYISVYDFKQSIEDGATVPLFYENRIPELQLTDEAAFQEGMERILEEAELDEDQEKKLEREFAREYHLITRDERLERVAQDIVEHFTERGFRGKAMVVSIDKATAVKMYDKVKAHWARKLTHLRELLEIAEEDTARDELRDKIAYLAGTDMAVVVSAGQNEIEEMRKKGVDIAPHRKRMVTEDLDTKFKDPENPFRLVFVCAMWMTGFDVPSCSTIYLDKPMRNHTLMQTIARANRVFGEKVNGLIVDYVGVFRSLQKALAIYGKGGAQGGREPVQDKAELVEMLREAVVQTTAFLAELGVDVGGILGATGFQRVKLLDDAVDAILVNDATRRRFVNMAGATARIFKAILPDKSANEFVAVAALFRAMQLKIESLTKREVDISGVMDQVGDLLDASVATKSYIIREPVVGYGTAHLVDLSQIDFEALKKQFAKSRKRMEVERLRAAINAALTKMVKLNKTRLDYLAKFQEMIDEYNSGAVNVEEFFRRLVAFAGELRQEEKRAVSEKLTEEELAVFDLITKPDIRLTGKEEIQVKKVAKDLLATLKREKLFLDWRKKQATRAAVRLAIEEKLDELPERFTTDVYRAKCDAVYQHVFESYYGDQRSVYPAAM
ncbi:MAG: type I restriction endonuclease subunit R [Deferrisomatales bacterium]|nr:type I restriction endonuclease subunit R [Deferrisomatales bacterium]